MSDSNFIKLSSAARKDMSLDALVYARQKTASRLDVLRRVASACGLEGELARFELSLSDLNVRISRRIVALKKQASLDFESSR